MRVLAEVNDGLCSYFCLYSGEYILLRNNSDEPVNVKGWSLVGEGEDGATATYRFKSVAIGAHEMFGMYSFAYLRPLYLLLRSSILYFVVSYS